MFGFARGSRVKKYEAVDLVWNLLEQEKREVVHRAHVRAVAGDKEYWWVETNYCDPPNTIPPLSRLFAVNRKTGHITERAIEEIVQFEWWRKTPLEYSKNQQAHPGKTVSTPAQKPTSPKDREFPSEQTIGQLAPRELYEACWVEATDRERQNGYDDLNNVERICYCLINFEGYVNNGGLASWLFGNSPQVLRDTTAALKVIESSKMSALMEKVFALLPALDNFNDHDSWYDHFTALPDAVHAKIEELNPEYAKHEPEMFDLVNTYARQHWREVRPMDDPGHVV